MLVGRVVSVLRQAETKEKHRPPPQTLHRRHGSDGPAFPNEGRLLAEPGPHRPANGLRVGPAEQATERLQHAFRFHLHIRILPGHEASNQSEDFLRTLIRHQTHADLQLSMSRHHRLDTGALVSPDQSMHLEGGSGPDPAYHIRRTRGPQKPEAMVAHELFDLK